MGQEKHMALLGNDHLLLLLGHCGRFQDHYESTLVNDKENNEYSDNSSPLVNTFGALFWHSLHFNLENYIMFFLFHKKKMFSSYADIYCNVCLNNPCILILLFGT